jgi:hypothetical protein
LDFGAGAGGSNLAVRSSTTIPLPEFAIHNRNRSLLTTRRQRFVVNGGYSFEFHWLTGIGYHEMDCVSPH